MPVTSASVNRRLGALLAAVALALAAAAAAAPAAAADDLDETAPEVFAAIEAAPWPEYENGDVSPDIRAAKYIFSTIEINAGPLNAYFDDDLEAALLDYQRAFDLHDDGRLNQETWLHLRDQVFGAWGPGDVDPMVAMIQGLLNAKYNYHLVEDGIYGYWTEQAVRDVQAYHGVGVDGIFGKITFRAVITDQDYDT